MSLDPHSPATAPSGRITSTTRGELFAHWFGSLVWNGLFGSVAVLMYLDRLDTPTPVLDGLLLVMAALGPLLLVRAFWESYRAWRFRGLELQMQPAQGSLGGELGGTLTIPVRVRDADAFRVSVSCVDVERGSESTRESVTWTSQVTPTLHPASRGSRLEFSVALPDHLPPSTPEVGESGTYWAVRVTGDLPGVDLDAGFRVPVTRHDPPRRSPFRSAPEVDGPVRELRGPGIRVDRDAGAVIFRYGVRRSFGMGLGFFLFGGVFAGAGTFIAVGTGLLDGWQGGFEALFQLFGSLFLLIFAGLGLLLATLGVWLMGNTLRVEVTPDRVRTRRRVLLVFSWSREVATRDIEGLEATVTSQTGAGPRASVGYRLVARTATGKVTLGDGIRGPELMGRIARSLEDATGLQVTYPARRVRVGSAGGKARDRAPQSSSDSS